MDRFRSETEVAGLTQMPVSRYRSVLVPLDGEPFAEHALPFALGIARRTGAKVRLVHVHSPLPSSYRPETPYHDIGLDAWNSRHQQAYLDDLVRRLAKVTSVPITPVLMRGAEVIASLGEAARTGADLVVMATHQRGMVGRIWHGSVAEALMQEHSVPLLLVRGYNAPADFTGDPHLRRILVPLDGSELAEQILQPALALGALTKADHTLLRVVPVEVNYLGKDGGVHQRSLGERSGEAQAYLWRVSDRVGGPTSRVRTRMILEERPTAEAILDYAQVHEADLIALATKGRGGLMRLFQDSVAVRVVRGASAPVLVYRPNS
jgi:nucleotide-binding universal stress UspA family protein